MRYRPRPLVVPFLAVLTWLAAEPSTQQTDPGGVAPLVVHRSTLAARPEPDSRGEAKPSADDARMALAMFDAALNDAPPQVVGNAPRPAEIETDWARRKKQQALALIHYPWQQLGYEIVFLGARPGFRAMTISDRKRIEVYARPGDDIELLAFDVAHEIGHAFDLERNSGSRRSRWREMRGISPSIPWFGCNRCPDYQTPAGDFAETFALLLLGPTNYHSRIALAPTVEEIPDLAEFCGIQTPQMPQQAVVRKAQ